MNARAIDVVVLSLDRLEDTHECIDSILAQDHSGVRLWVLDQGSRPSTVASFRQRSDADGFHFEAGERTGVAAGRNRGYRMGTAPIIVALDNDAVLSDPTMLTKVEERFTRHSNLGALAFAVHDYVGGGPDLGCWGYPWSIDSHFQEEFRAARFCGAGHAVSRKAYEATGGYDEQLFFFAEELDLSWSLISLGYDIRYVPEISVRHKSSLEARVSWVEGRYYYNVRNMLYLTHKYFRDPFLLGMYTTGYLLKGIRNGLVGSALKGVRDGLRMARNQKGQHTLDHAARAYIKIHEYAPRGSFWQRFRREVVEPLKQMPSP